MRRRGRPGPCSMRRGRPGSGRSLRRSRPPRSTTSSRPSCGGSAARTSTIASARRTSATRRKPPRGRGWGWTSRTSSGWTRPSSWAATWRKEQPLAGLRLRKAALAGASVFAVNPIDYPFNFELAGRIVVSPDRIPGELASIARAAVAGAAGAGGEGGPAGSDAAAHRGRACVAAALAGAERAVVLLGSGAAAHPESSRDPGHCPRHRPPHRGAPRVLERRPERGGGGARGNAPAPGSGWRAGRFAGPRRGRHAGREAPRLPPPRHRARVRRREQRGGPRGPRGSALGGRPHRIRVSRDGVVRERAPPDRPLHRDPGHLLQRGRAAPALRGGDRPARGGAPGVADPARAREPARRRRLRPRRHRGRAGGGGCEHRGGRAARQPRRPGARPRPRIRRGRR